jgi:hypothetical protein
MQTQCIAERSSELPLMHIQNESVDTRARGLTINPMIQTKSDDDESGVGEGTGENGDGRDSGLTAVELGSGEEETGQSQPDNNDAQQQALKQLLFYRALFAEDAPRCFGGGDFPRPPGTTTPVIRATQVYYVLIRVAMVATLGLFTFFFAVIPQNIWRYGLNLPSILATSACLASSFILPSKLKGVAAAAVAVGKSPDDDDGESRRARRRLLDVEDINWAGRKGCIFFTLWFVAGVSFSICLGVLHSQKYGLARGIQAFFVFIALTCPTSPRGMCFVLALDIARIKKEIADLLESARDRSLTLEAYQRSQDYIQDISASLKQNLATVAVIALYNTVGLLIFLYYNSEGLLDKGDGLLFDFVWMVLLGKEASLFFIFVYLAVVVNDAADDVCTEIYLWPTAASDEEEAGSDVEAGGGLAKRELIATRRQRRVELIAQATTFVGPRQRKYRGRSWWRLAAQHSGGISFTLLGVRWTSKYFIALIMSAGASVLSGLGRTKFD